jgi:hypothetical protein
MKRPFLIHPPKCGGTSISKSLGVPEAGVLGPDKHITASEICSTYAPQIREFTFMGVTRNPYRRALSYFKYHQERALPDFQCTFSEWVHNGFPSHHPGGFMQPMHTYFFHNGECLPSFIFKLENLQEKWPEITAYIGKPELPLLGEKLNASSADQFHHMLDEPSRSVIYDFYQKDFKLFEYPR